MRKQCVVASFMKSWAVGVATLMLGSTLAVAMEPIDDVALAGITGQNLIVADTIVPVAGAGLGFQYTRVGLNAIMDLNMNINKLQLGCGGFNESILSNACDIDMDYVSFMGRSGTGPGAVGSDFRLTRPYVEIATKGANLATREVVGFKVGAQSADGFFGVGRVYNNGETNLEKGGVCNTAAGPGNNAGRALCHSGINTVSGNLRAELSGRANLTVFGIASTACFGRTALAGALCNTEPQNFQTIVGTRITDLLTNPIQMQLDGGLAGWFGSGYASIQQNLSMVHGFAMTNTSDFFISFQRERVSYPSYDFRGTGAYSAPANAGWWMNVPDVKLVDLDTEQIDLGANLGAITAALASPGLSIKNIEMNSVPPTNCWGGNRFC